LCTLKFVELSVYESEHENEASHWWFVVRREMFARLIQQRMDPAKCSFVDIGTSTGTNLRMLRDIRATDVTGVELEMTAADFAYRKTGCKVIVADCTKIPLPDSSVDCVLATDVLEHVNDHAAAAKEIKRLLRPGGIAVVTVPAFMVLWGPQDELSHHKRRYRKSQIIELLHEADLKVEEAFYFNFLLLPPIFIARQILRHYKRNIRSEGDVNTRLINALLLRIFRIDCWLAPRLRIPFGVSVCVIVRG
jgi:SAM-dependent methyltransferase